MYTFVAGTTPALCHAKHCLRTAGIPITETFRWDVKHLLLDVPSFRSDSPDLITTLSSLPREITVWGGNLQHPALKDYHCIDLLKFETYLTENAAITADCTLTLMEPMLSVPLSSQKILIIGWGRIGKFLASRLKETGADITVAARKDSDRHRLTTLGFQTMNAAEISAGIADFDIIINTAPATVLTEAELEGCHDCLKIDLASNKGLPGDDVVWARGLPGKLAPERSGRLIAETVLSIMREEMK